MKIKIFADGSNIDEMIDVYKNNKLVKGFTTNPSLLKKAGVTNYKKFISDVVSNIPDLPISFEVFADDAEGMYNQAKIIASYGSNINVKIPIVNTAGILMTEVIKNLVKDNIKVNVTAVFTPEQIDSLADVLPHTENPENIVSIFAGRIADVGQRPHPYIIYGLWRLKNQAQILWASPRQVYDIYDANDIGCHIITVTPDLIKKLSLKDKNLTEYSIETVKMFYNDAKSSGLQL